MTRRRSQKKKQNSGKSGQHRSRSGRHQQQRQEQSQSLLRGRVQKNPRGFAFLIAEDRRYGDAFLSEEQAQGLLDDDVVEYRMRGSVGRASAELVRILERRRKQIVGCVRFVGKDRQPAVATSDSEYFLLEGGNRSAPMGQWVLANIIEYPTDRKAGTAEVVEKLGDSLSPKHDVRVAAARFAIPTEFSKGAIRDAEAAAKAMDVEVKLNRRRDLTQLPLVTIDGEDAKDFDDAVAVEPAKNGKGFILYVAIADVAFFVREGNDLDKDARERATSVYFPGTCIPMLPEELSNGLCSLRPKETRLALVAEIDVDAQGFLKDARFYEAVIRTAERLTYAGLQGYVDGDPEQVQKLSHLAASIDRMKQLYKLLDKRRFERGVLDFDLPESKIQVDAEGRPIKLGRTVRHETMKWIEEFMISANQVVAKELRECNANALYRVHEEPSEMSIEEANTKLTALGFAQRVEESTPPAFAKVIWAIRGKPGSQAANFVLLRAQRQAHYEPEPMGHFGLALRDYAHFTSPIRRYPDLVVHRALKSIIADRKSSDTIPEEAREEMEKLGRWTSERERRATEAERFVTRRKQCWWFKDRLGEEYEGRVNGTTPRGLFVTLGDTEAEGFLPVDSLPGLWIYDEVRARFVAKPGGRSLALGSELKVSIVRVSIDDNQVELGYVPQAGEPKPGARKAPDAEEEDDAERPSPRRRPQGRSGRSGGRPQPDGDKPKKKRRASHKPK